jgi:hypothetical protein
VDQQVMLDALLNDQVEALILECAFVDYITSINCELFKVRFRLLTVTELMRFFLMMGLYLSLRVDQGPIGLLPKRD